MSVLLHDRPAAVLARVDPDSRLGSYLFYGPRGVGKATAAAELARRLACPEHHAELNATCAFCRQFATGAYPDFYLVAPQDKPSITIEQIRRLSAALSSRPYHAAGLRMVLIDDAQQLTLDAQNALLKLIEEPPPRTLIVLVADAPERLLTTVRSRCVAVYFPPPPAASVVAWLVAGHPELTPAAAASLVSSAVGAPGAALALASDAEAAAAHRELHEAARDLPTLSVFERLRLAASLANAKADLAGLSSLLQAGLTTGIRERTISAPAARPSIQALERFRRRLAAGVAPRVALETLMLEF